MSSVAPSVKSHLAKTPRIALAGNPNSGKTTLFNALTGLRHKVANYPGVTVERKSGLVTLGELDQAKLGHEKIEIIDLPGIYSLSGQADDERISTALLLGEIHGETRPEIIVAVVDASNVERNLYLTTQLIDLGRPVIVALTMNDTALERGITVRTELLAAALGVPVVAIGAKKKKGLDLLINEITKAIANPIKSPKQFTWLPVCAAYRDAAEELGALESAHRGYPQGFATLLLGTRLLAEEIPPSTEEIRCKLANWRTELLKNDIDPNSFEASARYTFINWSVQRSVAISNDANSPLLSHRIIASVDKALTHRVWGLVIFALVMGVIFQAIFTWSSVPMDFIDSSVAKLGDLVSSSMPPGILRSLLVDGIIAGVGSVLVFIPQIAILFAFIGILEDSGYLSRAAYIMDRVMRQVGLQGRSFIPMLSSFACAIPGIMATRSIPSFADRMVTILVAPLMSCSARLPVYTLLIAAFIPASAKLLGIFSLQGAVLLGLYLLGIIGAAFVAWVLKLTAFRGKPALFVMEMPPLRRPSVRTTLMEVFDRVVIFVKGAGSVILACSIILWALASFPEGKVSQSYAGQIGHAMEPVIKPLGWNWEVGVGILASFAAREVFISALATVYNLERSDDSGSTLTTKLKEKRASGVFTLPAALSLLVFYVFACQCMSTLAVCRRETGGWRWPMFMFGYMSVLAYGTAWMTYKLAIGFGL